MTKEDLIKVHQRIQPYIHNTAVLRSSLLDEIAGASLFFKCEKSHPVNEVFSISEIRLFISLFTILYFVCTNDLKPK